MFKREDAKTIHGNEEHEGLFNRRGHRERRGEVGLLYYTPSAHSAPLRFGSQKSSSYPLDQLVEITYVF